MVAASVRQHLKTALLLPPAGQLLPEDLPPTLQHPPSSRGVTPHGYPSHCGRASSSLDDATVRHPPSSAPSVSTAAVDPTVPDAPLPEDSPSNVSTSSVWHLHSATATAAEPRHHHAPSAAPTSDEHTPQSRDPPKAAPPPSSSSSSCRPLKRPFNALYPPQNPPEPLARPPARQRACRPSARPQCGDVPSATRLGSCSTAASSSRLREYLQNHPPAQAPPPQQQSLPQWGQGKLLAWGRALGLQSRWTIMLSLHVWRRVLGKVRHI